MLKKSNLIFAIILAVFLLSAPSAVAQGTGKTVNLTFAWEQAAADTSNPGFGGWKLYRSATAGGPYALVETIPFSSPGATYTATRPISSPDGTTSTWFFVLTAFDSAGNESGRSNEVSAVIDFEAPGMPVNLRVTVVPGNP
jgi:hypothetical protein